MAEQLLVFIMVFGLMIGVGCSISMDEVSRLKTQKKEFLLGAALQYISMPIIAVLIARAFNLSSAAAFSLILIACCPGGATSNMFSYFSRANVSLSVSFTSITSLLAFVMTPALLAFHGRSMEIHIPAANVIGTVSFTLIPIFIGVALKLKSLALAARVQKVGTIMGQLAVLIMIGIWVPRLTEIFKNQDTLTFVSIGLLSLAGMLFGLLVSSLGRVEWKERRTLALETGIQNAPLAFLIVQLNYSAELNLAYGWIPLVYGALSVGNAILFTFFARLLISRQAIDLTV